MVSLLMCRDNSSDSEGDKGYCENDNEHTANSAHSFLCSLGNIGVALCISDTDSQFKRDPVLYHAHTEFSDLLDRI